MQGGDDTLRRLDPERVIKRDNTDFNSEFNHDGVEVDTETKIG